MARKIGKKPSVVLDQIFEKTEKLTASDRLKESSSGQFVIPFKILSYINDVDYDEKVA